MAEDTSLTGRPAGRRAPDGSNEVSPATTAALLALFSARPPIAPQQARRAAASLIRCMDRRDVAGAEALIVRLGRRGHLDAVLACVWWLEWVRADRARRRAHLEAQQREWLSIAVALLAGAMAEDEAASEGWRLAA